MVSSEPAYRRLFEPLRIGDFEVRNRILNATHGTGLPEARDVRYLQERARGGAAFLGVHASHGVYSYAIGPGPRGTAPDWDARWVSPVSPEGIAHFDAMVIPGLERRAAVVHAEGARCFAQVYHSGAAMHAVGVAPVIAPSAVPDPYESAMPHPLSEAEIEELVVAFAHGIRRAQEGGQDAAEIHAAHGYLVHEFLSPYFNRRTDRWGGSPANRVRFALEIIAAAREMVGPSFPIGIRVGLDDAGAHRGMTVADLAETCRLLAPHVAYISVSGGSYAGFGDGVETAYVSPWYTTPGFNAPASAAVRQAVDVPVFVTGRVTDAETAERLLADGCADMVGMVRALIADPELPRKVQDGRAEQVRRCVGLSECHHIGPYRTPVTCAVNASAGREVELEIIPADIVKTVVVVGAGPAGMEAARVAALRGHRVRLVDAHVRLGGTPAVLAVDPNRQSLREQAAYFETELTRLGVELSLDHWIGADELVQLAPDAVVLAVGGTPLIPEVAGIGGTNVLTALDALRGAETRPRALVVGGFDNHLGPPSVAEFLADRGKRTEMISEHFDFARGAEDATRYPLAQRLRAKGVTVSLMTALSLVDEVGAVVTDTLTRAARRIDDVTIVLACGLLPNAHLAEEVGSRIPEVHVIGDALAPRRIMHATLDGARVAHVL
jgi:2,4-dienoyl-CoA reductase-like NADH-dependent reductase (Old Yellow Enzyme family)/thioredoxin reductase